MSARGKKIFDAGPPSGSTSSSSAPEEQIPPIDLFGSLKKGREARRQRWEEVDEVSGGEVGSSSSRPSRMR